MASSRFAPGKPAPTRWEGFSFLEDCKDSPPSWSIRDDGASISRAYLASGVGGYWQGLALRMLGSVQVREIKGANTNDVDSYYLAPVLYDPHYYLSRELPHYTPLAVRTAMRSLAGLPGNDLANVQYNAWARQVTQTQFLQPSGTFAAPVDLGDGVQLSDARVHEGESQLVRFAVEYQTLPYQMLSDEQMVEEQAYRVVAPTSYPHEGNLFRNVVRRAEPLTQFVSTKAGQFKVVDDTTPANRIPVAEATRTLARQKIEYTWYRVPYVPDAAYAYLNRTNASAFDIYPAQSLVLDGVDVAPQSYWHGIMYDVTYRMTYYPNGANRFLFFDPADRRFKWVSVSTDGTTAGSPPYHARVRAYNPDTGLALPSTAPALGVATDFKRLFMPDVPMNRSLSGYYYADPIT